MVTSTLTSSAVHSKKKKKNKTERLMRRKKANALVIDSDIAIRDTLEDIRKARALAAKAGLSIECQTLPKTVYAPVENNDTSNAFGNNGTNTETTGPITTGGYLNKDHEVAWTGDEKKDRLAELRRNVWRRYRAMEPENRQEYRWDRPRQPGERRRRITRDLDLPDAPPEPPLTGFTAFMCQMTIKLRHDRPNVPHNQSKGKPVRMCTRVSRDLFGDAMVEADITLFFVRQLSKRFPSCGELVYPRWNANITTRYVEAINTGSCCHWLFAIAYSAHFPIRSLPRTLEMSMPNK